MGGAVTPSAVSGSAVSCSAVSCSSCGAMVYVTTPYTEHNIDDLYNVGLCILIFLLVAWVTKSVKGWFIGI